MLPIAIIYVIVRLVCALRAFCRCSVRVGVFSLAGVCLLCVYVSARACVSVSVRARTRMCVGQYVIFEWRCVRVVCLFVCGVFAAFAIWASPRRFRFLSKPEERPEAGATEEFKFSARPMNPIRHTAGVLTPYPSPVPAPRAA